MTKRAAKVRRQTRETRIEVTLQIEGSGRGLIQTGIPFFDHMLELFTKHALLNLTLKCRGDLEVDAHHTVEDTGLALGQAFNEALGKRAGIRRYGSGFNRKATVPLQGEAYVPMDETLVRCVVDFSGRPHFVWRGFESFAYSPLPSGDMACSFRFGLAREFFNAFSTQAKCNLHLELLYGDEPHHISEAAFKAFAKAVDFACQSDPRLKGRIPSTKGTL